VLIAALNILHTKGFLRNSGYMVSRGSQNSMLDVDCWSYSSPVEWVFPAIGDSVHGKDISVFCYHFMSFNWITILGYHKRLQKGNRT
jgi:hypothetical protein